MPHIPRSLIVAAVSAAAIVLPVSANDNAGAQNVQERWISQWDEGVCRLIRARGEPLAPYLMLEVIPGSQGVELWLVNPDLDLPRNRGFDDVSIRLAPAGSVHSVYVRGYYYRGDRYYVVYLPPALTLEAFAAASAMQLDRSDRQLLDMRLPPMNQALPVLRDCMNDLLRTWGIDPATYNALRRPPRSIGNMASWVSSGDYPYAALSENQSGRSVVRVTVGTDGRARDCVPIVSSGSPALDRRTCDISRRGRFEPALDAEGRPTEAPLIYSITWRLYG